jgi:hypothetical protein
MASEESSPPAQTGAVHGALLDPDRRVLMSPLKSWLLDLVAGVRVSIQPTNSRCEPRTSPAVVPVSLLIVSEARAGDQYCGHSGR